uniref:Uncharacterized protein n=1 Tax=Tetranychus urticae TaxID=32264 RepID=T1K4X3_TETUR
MFMLKWTVGRVNMLDRSGLIERLLKCMRSYHVKL